MNVSCRSDGKLPKPRRIPTPPEAADDGADRRWVVRCQGVSVPARIYCLLVRYLSVIAGRQWACEHKQLRLTTFPALSQYSLGGRDPHLGKEAGLLAPSEPVERCQVVGANTFEQRHELQAKGNLHGHAHA
jgi:hypothetical protein